MSPARLIVTRTPPGGLGDQYPITVWVDGERLAQLLPGDSLSHEVTPGAHLLRANNTLVSKRRPFDAAAGEEVRFVTHNRASWATMVFALLGAGPLSLHLEREGPERERAPHAR